MARSYRGKEIDMVSLAKQQGENIALGNGKMNGNGDILGKGGKVVQTYSERMSEFFEANTFVQKQTSLKPSEDQPIIDEEIDVVLKEEPINTTAKKKKEKDSE